MSVGLLLYNYYYYSEISRLNGLWASEIYFTCSSVKEPTENIWEEEDSFSTKTWMKMIGQTFGLSRPNRMMITLPVGWVNGVRLRISAFTVLFFALPSWRKCCSVLTKLLESQHPLWSSSDRLKAIPIGVAERILTWNLGKKICFRWSNKMRLRSSLLNNYYLKAVEFLVPLL